jgi:CubicO group peptidase (beta-lactamase class C family)
MLINVDESWHDPLQALLDRLVATGGETGVQLAVYHRGRLVFDGAAGLADSASGRPTTPETLFTAFSCSKGVVATLIHLLAERGTLAIDDPVARYWPEFAQHGKERVTLRHVLAHTSGIPQMPSPATPEAMLDWNGMAGAIAALPPLWRPGERSAYHALTFGWILGEVARRADGRSFPELVAREIADPLGIEDLYFGLPDTERDRVAVLESGPPGKRVQALDALLLKAIPIAVTPSPRVYNRDDVRRAVIPAAGGITTARSLARMYTSLIGPVDGVQLFKSARLRDATALQVYSDDPVLEEPIPKALGYFLGGPASPMGTVASRFGHPGAGGSIGFADPARHLGVAFLKNRLLWSPESPSWELVADTVTGLADAH